MVTILLQYYRRINVKFAIDFGHNVKNDTGAVGIGGVKEDYLTDLVGGKLIDLLKSQSHQTLNVTPRAAHSLGNSLAQRTRSANNWGADIFVSIHFNAFNGKAYGSEVYATSSAGKGIAQGVQDKLVELGFTNRGVKSANFYVLKHTNMPAILVECCFIDSERDMRLFNPDLMAVAIAQGLIGEFEEDETVSEVARLSVHTSTVLKPSTEQSADLPTSVLRDIQVGNYRVCNLMEEEGHYAFNFEDELIGAPKHYIYKGACDLVAID